MSQVKTIKFIGYLADQFGTEVKVRARTPAMIMQQLISKFGIKFKEYVANNKWHLLKGPDKCKDIGAQELKLGFSENELHLIPAIEGSGNVVRIVIGIVLVVAGLYFGQPYLVAAGASLIVGGIVGLLTPVPKTSKQEQSNQLVSNLFQGAQNTTTQGGPVPLIFGRFQCGSVVVSAGITNEQAVDASTYLDFFVPQIGFNYY